MNVTPLGTPSSLSLFDVLIFYVLTPRSAIRGFQNFGESYCVLCVTLMLIASVTGGLVPEELEGIWKQPFLAEFTIARRNWAKPRNPHYNWLPSEYKPFVTTRNIRCAAVMFLSSLSPKPSGRWYPESDLSSACKDWISCNHFRCFFVFSSSYIYFWGSNCIMSLQGVIKFW
jgi:hypothetical protein